MVCGNNMQVIPVINCTTLKCFRGRVKKAAEILNTEIRRLQNQGSTSADRGRTFRAEPRVHIDIGRPPFTPQRNAVCVKTLKEYAVRETKARSSPSTELRAGQTKVQPRLLFEAHLMMPWNRRSFLAYLRMPFERVYVHWDEILRSASRRTQDDSELSWAQEQAKRYKKELGMVFEVQPSRIKVEPLPEGIKHVLVLAVKPGKSGQAFNPKALQTIRFLKKKLPNVTITVDGGVTPVNAKKIFKAGANAVTSGSYIWDSDNPIHAYNELRNF